MNTTGLTSAGSSSLARKVAYKSTSECVSPRRLKKKSVHPISENESPLRRPGSPTKGGAAAGSSTTTSSGQRPVSPMRRKKTAVKASASSNGGNSESSPMRRKRVVVKKTRLPKQNDDDHSTHSASSHCFVGAPKRTTSGRVVLPEPRRGSNNNNSSSNALALRLLRQILGEQTATLNQQSVDRALQKHVDALRSGQQKQQLKKSNSSNSCSAVPPPPAAVTTTAASKATTDPQQPLPPAVVKQRIGQLQSELKKQKSIMKIKLEIKEAEVDILTKERDQKNIKIQQLSWKMAKLKNKDKDKAASDVANPLARAASATTSTITAGSRATAAAAASAAEHQETILCAVQGLAKRAVVALEGKNELLQKVLQEHTSCASCQQPMLPPLDTFCLNDTIQLVQREVDLVLQQLKQAPGVEVEYDDDDDDNESDATPTMAGSEACLFFDEDEPPGVVETSLSGREQQERIASTTTLSTSDLEQKLREANQSIALVQSEKEALEEDFEETHQESQRKIAQLKAVLISCNERRKEAERQLRQLGKFDEERFAEMTKKHPDELVNGSAHRTTIVTSASAAGDDVDTSASGSSTSIGLLREVSQPATTIAVKDGLEESLREANVRTSQVEKELAECQEKLYQDSLVNSKMLDLLKESLEEAKEEKVTLEATLQAERAKIADLEAQLSKLHAEKEDAADGEKLEESKERKVEENSSKLQEARNALRRSEAKAADQRKTIFAALEKKHFGPSNGTDTQVAAKRTSVAQRMAMYQAAAGGADKPPPPKPATGCTAAVAADSKPCPDDDDTESNHASLKQSAETIAQIEKNYSESQIQLALSPGVGLLEDFDKQKEEYDLAWNTNEEEGSLGASQLARLEQKLAATQRELITAESTIVTLSQEGGVQTLLEETRESLRNTLAEASELRRKVAEAESKLNDADGKLVFLRNIMLSVVPPDEEITGAGDASKFDAGDT